MKIVIANDYTTPGGRHYKAGSTHEINDADARNLIFRGKATAAAETKKAPSKRGAPTTSAAAETTTTPAREQGKE